MVRIKKLLLLLLVVIALPVFIYFLKNGGRLIKAITTRALLANCPQSLDFAAIREELNAQGKDLAFFKIGFHTQTNPSIRYTGLSNWEACLSAAGVPFVLKSVDNAGRIEEAVRFKQASGLPHVIVYRRDSADPAHGIDDDRYFEVVDYKQDPILQAEENWRRHKEYIEQYVTTLVPIKDHFWIETINEPHAGLQTWRCPNEQCPDEDTYLNTEWLAVFAKRQAELAIRDGYKYAAFAWSSGEPEQEYWGKPRMSEFLQFAAQNRDKVALALHEYNYSEPTLKDTYNSLVGRFEYIFNQTDSMGLPRPTILITEFGWSGTPSADEIMQPDNVPWAAELYAQYPEVLGAYLWDVGDMGPHISAFTTYALQNYYEIPLPLSSCSYDLSWGSFGSGNSQFTHLIDVALDSHGNVYTVDLKNPKVQKFSSNGTFIKSWGSTGSGNGQFASPSGIGIDKSDMVFVADPGNGRIQIFDSERNYKTQFGKNIANPLVRPLDVAVDTIGNIYVINNVGNAIGRVPPENASMIVKFQIDASYSTVNYITSWDTHHIWDNWGVPSKIDTDSFGNIYVSYEYIINRGYGVEKYSPDGVGLYNWGRKGILDGQFLAAAGLAVDNANRIFVTDIGTTYTTSGSGYQRYDLQGFSPSGAFYIKYGSKGTNTGQFMYPYSVASGASGTVYIGDTGNNRVQKLNCAVTIGAGFVKPPTPTPTPTPVPPSVNKAIIFGSGGYVTIGDKSNLDMGTSDFTLEAWVKTTSATNQTIIFKGAGSSTTRGYWFWYNSGNDDLRLYIGNGTSRIMADSNNNLGLRDGKWHHVATVIDRGVNIAFFVDGQLKGTKSVSTLTGSVDTTNVFRISGLSTNSWKGTMDEVRVWKTLRTQTQIQQNKGVEISPTLTGLVSYWKFNEGNGTTVKDSTDANNGTLTGGTWTTGAF